MPSEAPALAPTLSPAAHQRSPAHAAAAAVAVVIPAYNRSAWLDEALRSVAAQTRPVDQVIVVDDGSTEDIAAVCRRFPGVHCLRQANAGVSAARNRGLAAVTSGFVVFLDNDDRLQPHAIATALQAFEEHPEAALVFGRAQPVDAHGQPMHWDLPPQPRVATYATLLAGEHVIGPGAYMARTEAVRAAGGFNPAFRAAEECDLWRRIARDRPIHFHGQVVFDYRIHTANTSSHSAAMLRGTLRMHDSHWAAVRASGRTEWMAAWHKGRAFWIGMYAPELVGEAVSCLATGNLLAAAIAAGLALRYFPSGFVRWPAQRLRRAAAALRRRLPAPSA